MSIIKGTNQIVAGFGGTKRPLGEVYFSQSSLATDNPGALPGWTGEYYENGKTLFPDLYNFVKADSTRHVTKAQYDSAIAAYGECPKYVVDENTSGTSLRLPKYANYIKMANSAEGITQKGAGLPNITGVKGSVQLRSSSDSSQSGALYSVSSSSNSYGGSGDWKSIELGLDASRSSAIYGASNTVQPAHTTLYPWISAYTSAIPASVAQAAEFQQGLSGKADTNLSNTTPSQSFKEMSVGWGMPDYSAEVSITAGESHIAPCDLLVFGLSISSQDSQVIIEVNNIVVAALTSASFNNTVCATAFVPKGASFIVVNNRSSKTGYFPLKGVN